MTTVNSLIRARESSPTLTTQLTRISEFSIRFLLLLLWALFFDGCAPVGEPARPDAPADHQGSRRLVAQDAGGAVTLHAKDASVHGEIVRYEPDPRKNTIGYWTDAKDWVSWEFEITRPGKFSVVILQGCGTGSGGSKVEFSVGDQVLVAAVQDTGGFQNFIARDIGTFTLVKAGRYTLRVRPMTKPGLAVMDLRQVKLNPADN